MPKALVAGGAGFVGRHVIEALRANGWSVSLFGPAPEEDGASAPATFQGDITEPASVHAAVEACGPDLIVSCVGFNADAKGLLASGEENFDMAVKVNALGLKHLLEAARATGTRRLLWTGSVVAYGPPALYGNLPVTESAPLRPTTVYGLTKALAEQFLTYYRDVHGLDAASLRLPLVFGPGRWYGGVLGDVLKPPPDSDAEALELTEAPFDLLYVKDAARCIALLAGREKPLRAAYNLAGFTTSFPDLLEAVAELHGAARPARFITKEMDYPLMSDRLLRTTTGYDYQYPVEAGLADMLKEESPR